MKELTPDAKKAFVHLIHRILILVDDWLCDTFNLSRKARGRYAPEAAHEQYLAQEHYN